MNNIFYTLKKINPFYWALGGIFFIIFLSLWLIIYYINKENDVLSSKMDVLFEHITVLESQFSSTTLSLQENIKNTESSLTYALQREKETVSAIKEQFGSVEKTVGNISGTVNTLEKLSKTDPELLQKYSKVFFLNEHYAPARLTAIPNTYKYFESKDMKIDTAVWPYLEKQKKSVLLIGGFLFFIVVFYC